jgi:hypothetical protein
MSEPISPWWLPWVLPFITVFGVLWAIVKKIFTNAVRAEMTEMHNENQARLLIIENRIGDMESSLQRILGRMQERWGDSRGD